MRPPLLLVAGAILAACGSPGGARPGAGAPSSRASATHDNVELPGVDVSQLTGREKSDWSTYVSELLAPCRDQPVSIAECVKEKRPCGACLPAARFLLKQVTVGKARAQIEQAFTIRFAADHAKTIDLSGAPVKGAPNAAVTIAEWADFECPFCGHAAPVLDSLLTGYPGQVRLVFKHFPLSAHKNAEHAARAAIAADRQGKFWEMHHLLFENQENLEDSTLTRLAKKIGLDLARFDADRASEATTQILERDRRQADALGLKATPMIYINGRHFDLEHFKVSEDLVPWVEDEIEIKTGTRPTHAAVAGAT